jgi:acyl carrier protein
MLVEPGFRVGALRSSFHLMNRGKASHRFARMALSKRKAPTPTELIDWLNGEGLLELDWDFPEDGDLFAAGLDSMAVMQIVTAVEDEYGVELGPEDLTKENLATPLTLVALLETKLS